jgi:hypothetical protein
MWIPEWSYVGTLSMRTSTGFERLAAYLTPVLCSALTCFDVPVSRTMRKIVEGFLGAGSCLFAFLVPGSPI